MLNIRRRAISRIRFLATTLTVFVAFGAARLSAQGVTWVPSEIVGCDNCGGVTTLHFTSPEEGWASARAIPTNDVILLRTNDGGQTWSPAPMNAPEDYVYEEAVFLNAMDGWSPQFRYREDTEENALDAPIPFYETSDGGNSWRLRQGEVTEFVTFGRAEAVAEADRKYFQSVRFVNRSVGVMAGVIMRSLRPERGPVRGGLSYRGYVIAVTRDGGATWKAFLFGMDDTHGYCGQGYFFNLIHPPLDIEFVGERHGWIPALTCANRYLFRTADGGRSWEALDIREPWPNNVGTQVEFVSPTEGWSWNQVPLTRTTDGGETWSVPANLPVGWSPVFVTRQEGWMIGKNDEESRIVTSPSIYRTIDNGITWKKKHSGIGTRTI